MTEPHPTYMTAAELRSTGSRLYGHAWKTPLAAAIGRSRVTVWRWAEKGVPNKAPADLIRSLLTSTPTPETTS